jgi:hypothetical protein
MGPRQVYRSPLWRLENDITRLYDPASFHYAAGPSPLLPAKKYNGVFSSEYILGGQRRHSSYVAIAPVSKCSFQVHHYNWWHRSSVCKRMRVIFRQVEGSRSLGSMSKRPVPGPPVKVWIALVPSAWVIGVTPFLLFEAIIWWRRAIRVALAVAIAWGCLGFIIGSRNTKVCLSGSPIFWAQSFIS